MRLRRLQLVAHPTPLVVTRLGADAPLASLLPRESAQGPQAQGIYALVRSADSVTVVRAAHAGDDELLWCAFEVAGPFEFSETGVIASVTLPLAEAGISVFSVSTFETDFVLVPQLAVDTARRVLLDAGHRMA